MLKIGITGGIGTGKSTVCKVFNVLSIPTFDADYEAKQLYNTNELLRQNVIARFGEALYVDEIFQPKLMASLVFNNAQALQDLNAMVHPIIIEQSNQWFKQQQAPYALKEAALLIESGGHKNVDKLIVVTAPLEERIERIRKRDHASTDEILNRMNKQMPEDEKVALADFVIQNADADFLIPQVLSIHQQLLKLCAS